MKISKEKVNQLISIAVLFILILGSCSGNKNNREDRVSENKEGVTILNDEVNTFWKSFNQKENRNQLLAGYVLDSVNNSGVNTMYRMTLNDTGAFNTRIAQFENYYKSIESQSLNMANRKYPKMDEYYAEFKKLYPKAHRPKLIFTVGALTVGGTVSDEGLLIATEFYGKNSGDTSGMERMSGFLLTLDDFVPLTFHEHMHYEQLKNAGGKEEIYNNERNLLFAALNEGAADFVSNLITGWNDDKPNYVYGEMHEEELWRKFKEEMFSEETVTEWMFDYNTEKDTPADLGYFMGAKICESYYNNAEDKAKAIEDILSIKDIRAFLKKSGYEEKFKEIK